MRLEIFCVLIFFIAFSKTKVLDIVKDVEDTEEPSEININSSTEASRDDKTTYFNISNDDTDLNNLKLPFEVPDNVDYQKEEELNTLIKKNGNTLLLVHVLFRHGNRTSESMNEIYPKDPYQHIDFFPIGLGQLTDAGKKREFNLGRKLRKRYKNFLGDCYYPQMIDARSTDTNRTKMSLQLVLASLFPSNPNDEISKQIGVWQPIPYNYVISSIDNLLLPLSCPNWLTETDKLMRTEPVKASLKKYEKVFDYLSQNTGGNISTFLDTFLLYYRLRTQKEYGLQLPEWTEAVYPEILEEMLVRQYYLFVGNYQLRKIFAGTLLKKIIQDSQNRLFANDGKFSKKMYLYSAHENNIASVLISLGVYEKQIPEYGSYILFEFHLVEGIPGFKIYFDNWTGEGPKLLQVPGCGSFCPFNKFVHMLNKELPLDNENACGK